MYLKGLFKVLRRYDSHGDLAKDVGRSRQTITSWVNREQRIPDLEVVLYLFCKFKGGIPLDELVGNSNDIRNLLRSAALFDRYPSIEVAINKIKLQTQCPLYKNQNPIYIDLPKTYQNLPIIIDSDYQLITCACRIHRSIYNREKEIYAHCIDLHKVISGEISIDSLVEVLPMSERIAIGWAVERILGNRQGKKITLPVDGYPQVPANAKTREIAAKCAGFKSDFSYRQAMFVVNHGTSATIHAMDSQLITLSKAKQIATLSQHEQDQVISNLSPTRKSSTTARFTGEDSWLKFVR